MDKELFYEKMKPYFEQGLVREVYSQDEFCILSVGEICYVCCSYIMAGPYPFGIYISPKDIQKTIENPAIFFKYQIQVLDNYEKHGKGIYVFALKNINNVKQWIETHRKKGISKIDYKLEEKINRMNKKGKIK